MENVSLVDLIAHIPSDQKIEFYWEGFEEPAYVGAAESFNRASSDDTVAEVRAEGDFLIIVAHYWC